MNRLINLIIVVSILSLTFLSSCRKDKLKGDYGIFLGKWEWAYSEYEYDKCQQGGGYSMHLDPSTENDTYQIEFFYKGKVSFFKNTTFQNEYRVVIDYFEPWVGPQVFSDISYNFTIYLDNDEENKFTGIVSADSLFTFHRPFEGNEPACDDYYNYWVKSY